MGDYVKTIRNYVGSRCIFVPGVRAIILNKANEVLLQRRTDMKLWGLPAGATELNESALDSLKREIAEETSLTVLEAEPMALYSGANQKIIYPNGDEIQCFALAFIVRKWEGVPQADGAEGSEVRFFPIDKLPEKIVPIHKKTLDDYRSYKGTFLLPE